MQPCIANHKLHPRTSPLHLQSCGRRQLVVVLFPVVDSDFPASWQLQAQGQNVWCNWIECNGQATKQVKLLVQETTRCKGREQKTAQASLHLDCVSAHQQMIQHVKAEEWLQLHRWYLVAAVAALPFHSAKFGQRAGQRSERAQVGQRPFK